MVLDTMVTTVDHTMVVTTGHTDMDTGDERRGKLKLSPQLQLMPMLKLTLILGIATMDMVWDTTSTIADHTMVVTTGHTDMDTGDERRGKLRLSPQLQLMPILKLTLILGIATMDMAMDTTDHMDMDTEAMDIGARMPRPSNQN